MHIIDVSAKTEVKRQKTCVVFYFFNNEQFNKQVMQKQYSALMCTILARFYEICIIGFIISGMSLTS